MQSSQVNGGQLEDHLRSLILNNTGQPTPHPFQVPVAPTPIEGRSLVDQPIPKREEQQNTTHPSVPAQTTPKGSRKRPNQAQRRQMQADLSIPIDTRGPAPHDSRRSYAGPHQNRNQRAIWPNAGQAAFTPNADAHNGGFQNRPNATNNPPITIQQRQRGEFSQGPNHQHSWRNQQPHAPDTFSKGVNVVSADAFPSRGRRPSQATLYNPSGQRQFTFGSEQLINQSRLLDDLCHSVVSGAEIAPGEIAEKENFRNQVEAICRDIISHHEIEVNGTPGFQPFTIQLKCFGSLSSGFATKAADMDLGLLSPMSRLPPDSSDSPIPRLIEKALLERGFGARLLTRTRVPIIKLCEKPGEKLHSDLLEARAKWDKGLADDGHGVVNDVIDDQDIPEGPAATTSEADGTLSTHERKDSHQPNDLAGMTYEEQLASLKQSETQHLLAYYNNAKRLLRRLNGRDITISNAADFSIADFKLLDDITNAFINGLYDDSLKTRVQSYPSFRSANLPESPNLRSLLGAFMIVEGETLVVAWETQEIPQGSPKLRQNSESIIGAWKSLLKQRAFGGDPLMFNREIHLTLERLRQIPLIQLTQLKQDQYESATQYYTRVCRVSAELGPTHPSNATLLSQVIQHYISGIRDKYTREEVQNFASSTGVHTLKIIARKHRTIHLAMDYERAIEKGLYSEEDIPVIQQYVKILREGFTRRVLRSSKRIDNAFDYIALVDEDNTAIIERIRQLPDPSRLSPNLPRDRYHDSLEFPKNGIGVQCDINFSAHLALQNTLLLRCYSYTDTRVRPTVLFVKHWAKARGINTPYRGTLSSYGYVLMVLHYLVNIVEPFVCPNLQHLAPPDPDLPAEALEGVTVCKGRNVRFWRDEQEIQRLASQGHLNQNRESIGSLLRGFFEYYAQSYTMSTSHARGFDWGRDVLSLRSPGGLILKQEKGWTGAKTVMQLETGAPPNPAEAGVNGGVKSPTDGVIGQPGSGQTQLARANGAPTASTRPKELKEVRHRYLFAIEDPFELEHNVARTVTHNGIVSIRDEFRRAWRIIKQAGKNGQVTENLLEDVQAESKKAEIQEFAELLADIHGP
ncbi:uncharacterized protein F4822DRAFT_420426 [Hypoxylon trugodes]|uniref:uncharacterized protein n=1 Tax=Hypoxylon trugodes TaxID=326681 RepID=UPI0021949BA2|nr:uncharacterized protein F4822DRAFT_420426 [Hypoxylon trugodes]KAI1383383.1 hypothetical protein F4822DRAFT_420426 [Hypoxylon trugodes]